LGLAQTEDDVEGQNTRCRGFYPSEEHVEGSVFEGAVLEVGARTAMTTSS
jgi:hypothetical protein